jgi:hypothetical protein
MLVTFDYQNPNYKLYKKDVLLLLGEPDRNVNNERFCYAIRRPGLDRENFGLSLGNTITP